MPSREYGGRSHLNAIAENRAALVLFPPEYRLGIRRASTYRPNSLGCAIRRPPAPHRFVLFRVALSWAFARTHPSAPDVVLQIRRGCALQAHRPPFPFSETNERTMP